MVKEIIVTLELDKDAKIIDMIGHKLVVSIPITSHYSNDILSCASKSTDDKILSYARLSIGERGGFRA